MGSWRCRDEELALEFLGKSGGNLQGLFSDLLWLSQ
jgi:hypothetical protein